jgi:glycosyltransferase involved in cell wall biosynthesis
LPIFQVIRKFPDDTFIFSDNSNREPYISKNPGFVTGVANMIYISNHGNFGLPKAYNSAINFVKTDFVVFLDQDTLVNEKALLLMKEEIHQAKIGDIFFPVIFDHESIMSPVIFDRKLRYKPMKDDYILRKDEFALPINSCTCIKTEAVKSIGGFDERYFLDFVDFSFYKKCYFQHLAFQVLSNIRIEQSFSGTDFSIPKNKAISRFKIFLADGKLFYTIDSHQIKTYKSIITKRAMHLFLKYHDIVFLKLLHGALKEINKKSAHSF